MRTSTWKLTKFTSSPTQIFSSRSNFGKFEVQKGGAGGLQAGFASLFDELYVLWLTYKSTRTHFALQPLQHVNFLVNLVNFPFLIVHWLN